MFSLIRKIYDWMGTKVNARHANWWLATMFFFEASIFFVPVDPLLIHFCVHNNRRSFFYATVATVASVCGGVFGYFSGSMMWQTIGSSLVTWIISEATFNSIVAKYQEYSTWAVLVAGFTPVPYKAVTISAGFCNLPLMPFIGFSLIARGARFFLVASSIKFFGERAKKFIDTYFDHLVVAFVLIVIISCLLLK